MVFDVIWEPLPVYQVLLLLTPSFCQQSISGICSFSLTGFEFLHLLSSHFFQRKKCTGPRYIVKILAFDLACNACHASFFINSVISGIENTEDHVSLSMKSDAQIGKREQIIRQASVQVCADIKPGNQMDLQGSITDEAHRYGCRHTSSFIEKDNSRGNIRLTIQPSV